MKIANKRYQRAMPLALALLGVAFPVFCQQNQTGPIVEKQFTPLIHSVEGPDLFLAYCASCHGMDARGAGPAAPALKAKIPDLTLLAANNRGEFPTERVGRIILGEKVVASHGPREMPIWGPVFHQVESDVDLGNLRVSNLVKYLQSIQSSNPSKSPSGAELYRQDCAVCHGRDLKGTGPAPYPFRAPPDLTKLARKHDGIFPDTYVSEVLRHGVVMPHGPAEMPIWGSDFIMSGLHEAQVDQRIKNLTNYIKSFQEQ